MTYYIKRGRFYGLMMTLLCVAAAVASSCRAEDANQDTGYSLPFIAVDLDGDGIEFIPLEQSRVYFDVNDDGQKERTAWVKPDDGLLSVGSNEIYRQNDTESDQLNALLKNGFERLRQRDLNKDGVIATCSEEAAMPNTIAVFQDLNSDGSVQLGEGGAACPYPADGRWNPAVDARKALRLKPIEIKAIRLQVGPEQKTEAGLVSYGTYDDGKQFAIVKFRYQESHT